MTNVLDEVVVGLDAFVVHNVGSFVRSAAGGEYDKDCCLRNYE